MLRGALGFVAVLLAASGVATAPAQSVSERGAPTTVTVALENERLRVEYSQGFTSPDVSVDYDSIGDDWVANGDALVAGTGCVASSESVLCPENGEDVTVDFNETPGDVTLLPADAVLNFKSRVRLGANNQSITTSDGADTITSDEETGSATVGDEIVTLGGDDDIAAGLSPDLIYAGLGDDTVDSGEGDDVIFGGAADSAGPDGADVLAGGQGVDLVSYETRADDVVATIGGPEGEDEIAGSVEDLTGGLGSDTLTGDNSPNFLRGGDDGDDTLSGGSGAGPDGADTFRVGNGATTNIDTVSYASRKDALTVDIGGGADDVDGDDLAGDVDNLIGGKAEDLLTGDDDDNVITGGKGEDTMFALGGTDTINALDDGPDTSNCGDGVDVAQTDVAQTEVVTACESLDSAPETTITKAPQQPIAKQRATIRFASDTPGVTGFECSLDGDAFAACSSPLVLRHLSMGKHRFEVRAIDADGDRDISPAKAKFKRVER